MLPWHGQQKQQHDHHNHQHFSRAIKTLGVGSSRQSSRPAPTLSKDTCHVYAGTTREHEKRPINLVTFQASRSFVFQQIPPFSPLRTGLPTPAPSASVFGPSHGVGVILLLHRSALPLPGLGSFHERNH